MNKWIKKLHMYVGLLNFTILVIFGVVGLATTFLPTPNERARPASDVRYLPFTAPGDFDDRELADRAYATLQLPLTEPTQDWNIQRGDDHDLEVRFFTPGKVHNVVVLEQESQLRVETVPFDMWQFLFHLHEYLPAYAHSDWRTQLWAGYVEFSIWSLSWMAVTGVYLWLVSRPGFRWAQIAFAAGIGTIALFYLLIR